MTEAEKTPVDAGITPQIDKAVEINKALRYMRMYENGHNSVAIDHARQLLLLILDMQPIQPSKLLQLSRTVTCIGNRYIKEYLVSFDAWGIIETNSMGEIVWVGGK